MFTDAMLVTSLTVSALLFVGSVLARGCSIRTGGSPNR